MRKSLNSIGEMRTQLHLLRVLVHFCVVAYKESLWVSLEQNISNAIMGVIAMGAPMTDVMEAL
jgi:hypothetical protein